MQIRTVEEQFAYFCELEERKVTVLKSIEEQGKLTPELRQRIEATRQKTELEDLYLPYKPKRRTKATIARERGLEPLADLIAAQELHSRHAGGCGRCPSSIPAKRCPMPPPPWTGPGISWPSACPTTPMPAPWCGV